jgi:cell division protein ZapA (FtsZ GTPase activity inhibitor)
VEERTIRVMNSTVNVEFPLREPKTIQEMADLVHNTVIQIQERFGQVSDSILTKGMTNWFGIDFFFLKFFI